MKCRMSNVAERLFGGFNLRILQGEVDEDLRKGGGTVEETVWK